MNKRLLSIILSESLIALAGGQVEAHRIARFCWRAYKRADAPIATSLRIDFENMKLPALPMPLRMNLTTGQPMQTSSPQARLCHP